jgi:hypothetical protein
VFTLPVTTTGHAARRPLCLSAELSLCGTHAAVGCPTVVGLGVVGHEVPNACVQAIVERLRAPLEVMTFPVSHDAGPAMRAWGGFDERRLGLALRGIPSGFGQHDPRGQHSAAASRTQAR